MSGNSNKYKCILAMAATAGLAFSPGAFATNGILQIGNGMVAHGLGGAGIANAGEAAAGMDNPALITQTGSAVGVGLTLFNPNRSADFGAGYVASDSQYFYIPQAAYTSVVDPRMSWGIMAYAMGGMNTDYPDTLIGEPSGVNLAGLIVAPTLAYKVTPGTAVGVSFLLGYESLKMRNVLGITGDDSATSYGVKLGFTTAVTDGVTLGATLQPKMQMGEIAYFCNALDSFGFSGNCQLTLPTMFGVGGKFALGRDVSLVADIMQVEWSGVDVFDFFGWQDQTLYKLGVEWRASDTLALRAGYNYGKSPIPEKLGVVTMNTWFPAVTESHVTLGASYKLSGMTTLTGYYLHAFRNTETDPAGVGNPLPSGFNASRVKMDQNALGIGINMMLR